MPNKEFVDDPCNRIRFWQLAGLTKLECSFARRLVMAVVLGGVIGWERREADRPAGIRTMALVSLASCLFTIGSAFAFRDGPQEWDASRISAAIPSGVGFLGAGLIFKGPMQRNETDMPIVHGLTTAASLWLSAAVGIACGGTLYFAATFTTAILLLTLRFGPRFAYWDVQSDGDSTSTVGGEDEEEEGLASSTAFSPSKRKDASSVSYGGLDSSSLSPPQKGKVISSVRSTTATATEMQGLVNRPLRASERERERRKSTKTMPQLL